MQTVLITLIGPAHRIDLKLPAEVPYRDLLPKLLELCGPQLARPQDRLAPWRLVLQNGGRDLPSDRSLRECGVVDGAVLALQDNETFVARQQEAATQTFRLQMIRPSASTGGIGVKWNIPAE